MLLSAAVLLGADCPHCDATQDLETASAHATPSCHEPPAEPAPVDSEHGPAIDCGCPSCEVEAGVASVATGAADAPKSWLVAVHVGSVASILPATRGEWTPPPYPGFSENTVVRLN